MMKSNPVASETEVMNFRKPNWKRRRNRKRQRVEQTTEYLLTDKPYFVPDYYGANSLLPNAATTIEVPSWRILTVPRFYKLDLPENTDDSVFEKRHKKYEREEKLRKKRDLEQRKGEQRTGEQGKLCKKRISLYPQLHDIEYIEITDSLPVVAFGHQIPVFQPIEFSLPWLISDPTENAECSKRMRTFLTSN